MRLNDSRLRLSCLHRSKKPEATWFNTLQDVKVYTLSKPVKTKNDHLLASMPPLVELNSCCVDRGPKGLNFQLR